MKCLHRRTWTRHRLLLKTADVANGITDKVCQRCGAQLSLGPSTDTPATAIELEAAELAASYADNNRMPGYDRFEWCPANRDGFCNTCLVFLLANVIARHDIDHKDSTP